MAVRGVLSHESAARLWGLDQLDDDGSVHLTVPRASTTQRPGVTLHRSDLAPCEVAEVLGQQVTAIVRTICDLARARPFVVALVVADSALRSKRTTSTALRRAAESARGPGAPAIRKVALQADGRSGSVLESEARAILIEARVRPLLLQHRLYSAGHPYDLAIPDARLLIEVDGYAGHRKWARFAQDCDDAVDAAIEDWQLLRFTVDVIRRRPERLVGVVAALTARRRETAALDRRRRDRRAARLELPSTG